MVKLDTARRDPVAPVTARALARLGIALGETVQEVRFRWRVRRVERNLVKQGEDTAALNRLAGLYEGKGRRDDAIATYLRLAAVYRRRRDLNGIVYIARKLEMLDYDVVRVYRDIATLSSQLGRHAEAAQACRRVIESYITQGHRGAAAGFLALMPQLGALERETRVELECLLRPDEPRNTLPPIEPRGSTASPPVPRADIFLTGTLGRITVFDVVQMAESNYVTGVLVLDALGVLDSAALHFDAGRMVAARFGTLEAHEATRRILQLEDAPFRLEMRTEPARDELGVASNTSYLLDVLRVLDEDNHDADEPASYSTSPLGMYSQR